MPSILSALPCSSKTKFRRLGSDVQVEQCSTSSNVSSAKISLIQPIGYFGGEILNGSGNTALACIGDESSFAWCKR